LVDGGRAAVTAVRQSRADWTDAATRVTLLDAFELVCDGTTVHVPLSAQRVVAFVALHRRPLQRAYVAGSLWLDTFDDRASASLRSALWRLHRCGHGIVDAVGPQLRLGKDVSVDLYEAEALAQRVFGHDGPADLDIDLSELAGDLLPDWYDDWLVIERERYRQLRLRALDALCDRLTRAGRLDDALAVGLAAVAGEPLRESAHRALIRVHLSDGNAAEAVRQYRTFGRLLREQLGIEPSERMKSLIRDLEVPETIR
jgi:DNA-binding SARP family transcriptional activator